MFEIKVSSLHLFNYCLSISALSEAINMIIISIIFTFNYFKNPYTYFNIFCYGGCCYYQVSCFELDFLLKSNFYLKVVDIKKDIDNPFQLSNEKSKGP